MKKNEIMYDLALKIASEAGISELAGSKVLVTGATGLIGKLIVSSLCAFNRTSGKAPVTVYAVVRNISKAEAEFGYIKDENCIFICSDIESFTETDVSPDYIIHCASNTSSRNFVNDPVGVIRTNITGTQNILEIARKCSAAKVVFLSTMEVYGTPSTDEIIDEQHSTNLMSTEVRSCYPESKRMCENICVSYMSEYNVPVSIIRLTQTFGPGVDYNDGRVFAEFARSAVESRDIVLKTKGETKRSYLHVYDAVTGIFSIMLRGESGQAYNLANPSTYCSIYEMAQMVAEKTAGGSIKVTVTDNAENAQKLGYAPVLHMNLSVDKALGTGWKPEYSLEKMYSDMIEYMVSE